MNVSDLMRIFYFNRLAARVFTLDPDGWLIKGGQALLVRYRGAARLSGDIDLQAAQPGLAPIRTAAAPSTSMSSSAPPASTASRSTSP